MNFYHSEFEQATVNKMYYLSNISCSVYILSFKDNTKSELKLSSDEEEEALLKHEQHCLKFDKAAVVDEIEKEPRRSPRSERQEVEEA